MDVRVDVLPRKNKFLGGEGVKGGDAEGDGAEADEEYDKRVSTQAQK